MNRRGFLKGMLALGAAPAIITTSGLLMPVRAIARPENYTVLTFNNLRWAPMTATEVRNRYEEAVKAMSDLMCFGQGVLLLDGAGNSRHIPLSEFRS